MVDFKCGTGSWCKTFLAHAESFGYLLIAGRAAEISGRTANIVYISLEIGHLSNSFSFFEYRFNASYGYTSALMKSDRAEIAVTKAAAVVSDREAHLLDTRNAAERLIGRVYSTGIGEGINVVKLLGGETVGRGSLYQHHLAVTLYYGLSVDLVLPVILYFYSLCVLCLAVAHLLE